MENIFRATLFMTGHFFNTKISIIWYNGSVITGLHTKTSIFVLIITGPLYMKYLLRFKNS